MQQIDRYKIIRELGRGGMATVFLGEDPRFQRQVAIKVLPAQFTHDPQFRARFEREARTIAALEHPAIVPVYDFGEANHSPYLVMRNMSGGSLADRIDKGAMPVNDVLAVVRRIASALEAAHQKGIIHRDIKPANILFDQYNNAYLADFGIVKIAESNMTGTGIIGSPAYMSPEQAQGNDDIDSRSDIYALGIIIFEMLTGEAPYKGDTPVKQLMQRLTEPVPRITRVKPDLPPAIEPMVDKALARDPRQRYSTASALAHDFARITSMPLSQPAHTQLDNRTMVESPMQTMLDRPSTHQQVARPATNAGKTSNITHTPIGQTNLPAKKKKMPAWLMGVGALLGLMLCAGIIFGGYKALGSFSGGGENTPTVSAVAIATEPPAAATATGETIVVDDPTTVPDKPTTIPPTDVPSTSTPPPTPTVAPIVGDVTLWHSFPAQQQTAINAIINEFQAQYPTINFTSEFVPIDDMIEAYETAVVDGTAPDIFLGPLDWSAAFIEKGLIQDVAGLVSTKTWDALRPNLVSNAEYKGQQAGVPFSARGVIMYRNPTIIPEPIDSFAGILELDPSFYNLERGLYYSGGTLEAMGGQLMDADGNPTFNNASGVAWLERVARYNDAFSYGDHDLEAFKAGDVGLIIDGTWNMGQIINTMGEENVVVDVFPAGISGFTLSDLVFLSSEVAPANVDASVAFIEFMVSDEAQTIMTIVGGRVPARTNTEIKRPILRQIAVALDQGARFPIEPEMSVYWGPLTVAINKVYEGNDPALALQTAADVILQDLGR